MTLFTPGDGDDGGGRVARARALRKRMPPMEARMWNALRELKHEGFHFRRQMPLGPFYADFGCRHPRFVLEIDGETHIDADYDRLRDAFMHREGYDVLRVTNDDVRTNLDGVLTELLARLSALARHQPPSSPSPRVGGTKGGVEPRAPDAEPAP